MGSHKFIWVLFAGIALSTAACVADEDYYEGEIVPTRPVGKPSLDPTQPAELTGSTAPDGIPGINETKLPVDTETNDDTRIDGAWAEELDAAGEYIYVHNPRYSLGIDHVQVLDENGTEVRSFDIRLDATEISPNVRAR